MTRRRRPPAPPLVVERWFNTDQPITLESLRGRIVVLHAFQMLCPGCVANAIPQARKLNEIAKSIDDLVVLGIHTVFEHHAAMTPVSLEAFLHEYKITFPVAVDRAVARRADPADHGGLRIPGYALDGDRGSRGPHRAPQFRSRRRSGARVDPGQPAQRESPDLPGRTLPHDVRESPSGERVSRPDRSSPAVRRWRRDSEARGRCGRRRARAGR